jgi:chorismate--pyruvate lyase
VLAERCPVVGAWFRGRSTIHAGVRSADVNGCASCRAIWLVGEDDRSASAALSTALWRNTGTVTELLEHLAGEAIDADIRHQDMGSAPGDNPLGLSPGAPFLHRSVLLTGRGTGLAFVYAESAIAADRLPGSVLSRLQTTRDPIGRVLADHHLVVRRDPLSGAVAATHADQDVATLLVDGVHSRGYRILLDGVPAMMVSEWFLGPASVALTAHLGAPVSPEAGG